MNQHHRASTCSAYRSLHGARKGGSLIVVGTLASSQSLYKKLKRNAWFSSWSLLTLSPVSYLIKNLWTFEQLIFDFFFVSHTQPTSRYGTWLQNYALTVGHSMQLVSPFLSFRWKGWGIKKNMAGLRDYNAICPCELCRNILYDSYACCIHLDQCVKLRVNNRLPVMAHNL